MEITNKDICIVIPIYKNNINEPLLYDEVESIYHTIKVMHNYDIYFVCSQNLDISFYKKFDAPNVKYKFFEFNTRLQYSQMCLNYKFYLSFKEYKYMLICQTDAYIFRDELIDWCNKGYDYCGALILFDDNYKAIFGDENINIHGYKNVAFNGGFSLRNIKSFYDICLKQKERFSKITMNEDIFICFNLQNDLKLITIDDAIKFSAENQTYCIYPKLYNKLPFGCHTRKAKYKLFDIFNIKIYN